MDKKHPTHSLFHAFCTYPDLRFENQHKGEEIILVLRSHPLTQLPWIFSSLILFFIPLVLNFILSQFLSMSQVIFINIFWYSFIFSYAFLNILNYLFNVGIVTGKRVIDLDFHLILHKESAAAAFDDVSDVTVRASGFIPSFFNYGNVFVQTAGTEQNIEFLSVPRPTQVAAIINRLAGGARL